MVQNEIFGKRSGVIIFKCGVIMTQDERWLKRYQDVMDFMEKNHRMPF